MKAQEYTYTLPEGYTMEPQFREKLDLLVEEAQLPNELAQKFIDLHIELTEDFINRYEAAVAAAAADKETNQFQVAEYGPEIPQN
jgi:ferritin-like metal-binding protein YciE